MTRVSRLIALTAVALIVAALGFAAPVEAGTCSPVNASGKGKNMGKATAKAQNALNKRAAKMGGRVNQTNTDCVPEPGGYTCTISAVVCPQ